MQEDLSSGDLLERDCLAVEALVVDHRDAALLGAEARQQDVLQVEEGQPEDLAVDAL